MTATHLKKVGTGQQKAGKASGTNKEEMEEQQMQQIRLFGNRSVTCI